MFPGLRLEEKKIDLDSSLHAGCAAVANVPIGEAGFWAGEKVIASGAKVVPFIQSKVASLSTAEAVAKPIAESVANPIVENGASAALTMKSGWDVARVGKDMVMGAVIQGGMSALSTKLSSGWIVGPEEHDSEHDQAKNAEDGEQATEFNSDGLQEPTIGITYEPKLDEFHAFLANFKQKIITLMEAGEVQKWFE